MPIVVVIVVIIKISIYNTYIIERKSKAMFIVAIKNRKVTEFISEKANYEGKNLESNTRVINTALIIIYTLNSDSLLYYY